MRIQKYLIFIFILIFMMMFISCGERNDMNEKPMINTGFIPAKAGMYDSADTAVVVGINSKDKSVTFFNIVKNRNYTLIYDGTSKLSDKYQNSMSMEQINPGDIVDITFLKSKKHLNSLQLSESAWSLTDVSRFELIPNKKELRISDSIYNFTKDLLVYSNGNNAQIMDINLCDTIDIQGIGHTIYSISIDKGHGYLRLKNDEYFLGGWIEVGNEIIRTISEDMLLVVPEGTYDVLLSAKGISGVKKVSITRDKETELDIGDLKGEEIKKYGNLIFAITPDTATLYLDGEEQDISKAVKIEYGIHQMMAKAEGYQTIVQYIKVGQENATIQVTLEKQDDKKDTVSSNNVDITQNQANISPIVSPTPAITPMVTPPVTPSVSSNTTTTSTGYRVTVDAPADVEVYVDGNYVGIAPISFPKVEGIHVVTLRKTGYATRSYTINVDGEEKDASFSFSELSIIQ